MSLTLHYHPLSSFCWKVLMALYENDTPFTPNMVNLGDAAERAKLLKLWPIGKFPVLRDDAQDRTIPESSIIIEYLDNQYPGRTRFIAADAKAALQTRLRDRFYDLYVHLPMQKVVGDRLRPEGMKDPHGVDEAKARIQSSYGMIEREVATKTWAMGEAFGIADCAAAPALFYANMVVPLSDGQKKRRGLSGASEGAALLCARAQRSRAVFCHVPEIGAAAHPTLAIDVSVAGKSRTPVSKVRSLLKVETLQDKIKGCIPQINQE